MPTYEYRRPDGTTFEIQQSFSDEALTVDPQTGVPVERVLHAPAVHFKGKGFYNTDYGTRNRERETAAADGASSKADGASSKADGASGADSGSSSSGEGKGESAPASASVSKDSEKTKDAAKRKPSKPGASSNS